MTTIWEKTMLSSLGDHFEKKKPNHVVFRVSWILDGQTKGKKCIKHPQPLPPPPQKKIRIFRMNFLYCKLGPSSLCSYIQV
jgi:hypothetical protein